MTPIDYLRLDWFDETDTQPWIEHDQNETPPEPPATDGEWLIRARRRGRR